MKATIQMASVFLLGIAAGSLAIPALSAQSRSTDVKELIRTDLGTWCPGKEVSIVLQESGPGISSRHYHPGHSYSYVIEGSETRMVDGKPPQVARVGDVIHEEPMQVGETQNNASVKLLVFKYPRKGAASNDTRAMMLWRAEGECPLLCSGGRFRLRFTRTTLTN